MSQDKSCLKITLTRDNEPIENVELQGKEELLQKGLEQLTTWIQTGKQNADWINLILTILWPHLGQAVEGILRNEIQPKIEQLLDQHDLNGFQFKQINFGKKAPKLTAVRSYTYSNNNLEFILDLDIDYDGDLDFGISMKDIDASVSDVTFTASARLIFKPLIGDIPLIGGIQFYLTNSPTFDFDLGGIAAVLDLPIVKGILRDVIKDQIDDFLILPSKISIPITADVSLEEIIMPTPAGVIMINAIGAKNLPKEDVLSESDPYAIIQLGINKANKVKTKKISGNDNPVWDDTFYMSVEIPTAENLTMTVYDKDDVTEDDKLGQVQLDLVQTVANSVTESWMPLQGGDGKGAVHVKLGWMPSSNSLDTYKSTKGDAGPRCYLCLYLDTCEIKGYDCADAKIRVNFTPTPNPNFAQTTDESKSVGGTNPTFQQGFVFLLPNFEKTVLSMQFSDVNAGKLLAQYIFSLGGLAKMENMHCKLQSYDLQNCADGVSGTVSFSAK